MNFDSVQLVKCLVRNSSGQTSNRLIEKNNFDLWQYLVTTKHHITIVESSLCLWVSDPEFSAKRDIFERSGIVEQANRILLMTYDDHGNFNNTSRYVLKADTAEVEAILLSHVPDTQRDNQQFSHEVETGQIVTRRDLGQARRQESSQGQTSK